MKVLLIGHACSPYCGSEPGNTWNWAWHLSTDHEVWAIVHPQYREHVERYLSENSNPNLHFVFVTLPDWLDPWDFRKSERGIRLSYLLWQGAVLKKARELHRQHNFDVAHQVTMGTVGAPSPLWRLGIPFIWGSLGGGQVAPSAFRRYFGHSWWAEVVRMFRIRTLPFIPSLRKASRHSALLLATNHETKRVLEASGGKHTRLLLDCGTPSDWLTPLAPVRSSKDHLTLLWIGRLEPRKGLPVALEALAQVKDKPVRMLIVGQGPQRDEYEALSRSLGLTDRVTFIGFVQRDELRAILAEADVFLFTSLRDSSGSVVLEAMTQALPVLVLDHQGVGAFVPSEAGIKVPVTTPFETVTGLAHGIRRLLRSPDLRQSMGEAGWRYAKTQAWEFRATQMGDWYKECLDRAS